MEEKKERFNLLCVWDSQAILKSWAVITPGLEVMLENAGSDTSLDKIFNDLMSGQLLLWVGMLDGVYVGFVTTKIVDLPPRKKHLWIVHAFKTIKTPTMWLLKTYEILEGFAVAQKCSSIRFYGLRKKWMEKFEALGYSEGYVEMKKNL